MDAQQYRKLKKALGERGYNLVHRFVISELCRQAINYKGQHELWRITHIYKDALTPKELAKFEQLYAQLDEVHSGLKTLMYRTRATGDDGH